MAEEKKEKKYNEEQYIFLIECSNTKNKEIING